MQGATRSIAACISSVVVSIHAPYAGSDTLLQLRYNHFHSFNPRPLCRERLSRSCFEPLLHLFQSTPPMQGATCYPAVRSHSRPCFNPRPLCRERHYALSPSRQMYGFNPRPLCRERRQRDPAQVMVYEVSIHAPYAGSDLCTHT